MTISPLDADSLRPAYSHFLRDDRVLLTGHSHQAWPDVAREAVLAAFDDAAEHVDDKWGPARRAADAVRDAVVERIGGAREQIALGQNTHELVCRFLSALDLRARPHLVTTAGEFHSLYRQLRRFAEAGVDVSFVPVAPLDTLAARLAQAVREDTAAVLASSVLFETSSIVPGLAEAVSAAHRVGAQVLIDAYHAFTVLPFDLADLGEPVFVTGGGYKYAQWGEGCCFLRVPPGCELRPINTGWFSDFARLADPRSDAKLGYGSTPADRFAGSTYDPTAHYRGRAVAEFFRARGMSGAALRATSLRQTGRLLDGLDGFDVLTPRDPTSRAGFVAVRVPDASGVVAALRERGVWVDARGDVLRLGPAPYVRDDDLDRALATLRDVAGPG